MASWVRRLPFPLPPCPMAPGLHLVTVCVPSRLRMVGLLQVGYGRPLPPRLIRNVCVAGLAHYPANGVLLTAYLSARAAADIVVSLRRFLSTTLALYGSVHVSPPGSSRRRALTFAHTRVGAGHGWTGDVQGGRARGAHPRRRGQGDPPHGADQRARCGPDLQQGGTVCCRPAALDRTSVPVRLSPRIPSDRAIGTT